jgi:signal transduction histidine kinase
VLALACAYYGAAKLGQSLRYTGSVSAIWPPVGVGIASLYLWGLKWWPGVLVAEVVINAELLLSQDSPLGSLLGQQAGNVIEVLVGALLLRRMIGHRAALDRADQVGRLLVALGIATAISATVGTLSMLSGGVIGASDVPSFWRTWWLGDTAGALVVVPLALVWAREPLRVWGRIGSTRDVALIIAAVVGLGVLAFSSNHPDAYLVFPALIWAAFRFGPPGATLAVAVAAAVVIGLTAHEVGPFSTQPIDDRALATQVYVVVAALTTLFLSALVIERERAASELNAARRNEELRATKERHRIARDLHDSVSQALFSAVLHTRSAQRALKSESLAASGSIEESLDSIAELTRTAQKEMRALIFELGDDVAAEGLVAAMARHGSMLRARHGLDVEVQGPECLALCPHTQTELFGVGREALANVVKHAGTSRAFVTVWERSGHVFLEVRDDGCGFDQSLGRPGHFGLKSMRSRAADFGGVLTISSAPGAGTVVRVEATTDAEEASGGA